MFRVLQILYNYSIYSAVWLLCFRYQREIHEFSATTLYLIQAIAYWGLGFFCFVLDVFNVSRWRVESPRADGLSYAHILPQVLSTHLFVGVCSFAFLQYFADEDTWDANVYEASEWLARLVALFLIFDVIFYYGHRLIHHRLLYKHIHKLHHTSLASMGISGYYMGHVDALFEFILPTYLPFIILARQKSLLLAFVVVGQLNGVLTHSGHRIPGFPYCKTHLYHHLFLNVNFGIGIIDGILGTYLYDLRETSI